MITEPVAPKLRFVGGFSDKDAFDAQGCGYLSHVMVEFDDGRLYPRRATAESKDRDL